MKGPDGDMFGLEEKREKREGELETALQDASS